MVKLERQKSLFDEIFSANGEYIKNPNIRYLEELVGKPEIGGIYFNACNTENALFLYLGEISGLHDWLLIDINAEKEIMYHCTRKVSGKMCLVKIPRDAICIDERVVTVLDRCLY